MNYKKNKLFIIGVFAILLFTTCKKYEEGPCISLYSKVHRVVGTWTVESFFINGVDSTNYLQQQPLFGTYSFSKESSGSSSTSFVYNSNGNKGSDTSRYYTAEGKWSFKANKNNLFIEVNFNSPANKHFNIGPFGSTTCEWEIKRLKEKEMWLYALYNGREFYLKLQQ